MSKINRTTIEFLSEDELSAMDSWADRWIEIGLRTGPANRAEFERAVRKCYKYSNLAQPKKIIWVESPLVLALAAPIADKILANSHVSDVVSDSVHDAVSVAVNVAVSGAVSNAVSDAVYGAVSGAVSNAVGDAVGVAVHGAVGGAVSDVVRDAVGDAVSVAVHGAVSGAVKDAVHGAVSGAVSNAVGDAVSVAVHVAASDVVNDAVHGAVGGAVSDVVRDAVRDAVSDAVRDSVGDVVSDSVHDAVHGAVGGAVGVAVSGAVGVAVHVAVRDVVRDAVRDAVSDAVSVAVHGAVSGAVNDAVHGAVHGAVSGAVSVAVHDLKKSILKNWKNYIGGQFWVGNWWYGVAWSSFFTEVCHLKLSKKLLLATKAYQSTVESATWWWPHKDFIMVCERPNEIHMELVNPSVVRGLSSHRLHNLSGPSISWNGFSLYMIHGVRVPEYVVMCPEEITVKKIDDEVNAEVRRIMIDRFGVDRYVAESGTEIVSECPTDHPITGLRSAKLYRKELIDDEPIIILDMLNSTPEQDGTTKRYMIRIDPNAYGGEAGKSCLAAMASTYRMSGGSLLFSSYKDYAPSFES